MDSPDEGTMTVNAESGIVSIIPACFNIQVDRRSYLHTTYVQGSNINVHFICQMGTKLQYEGLVLVASWDMLRCYNQMKRSYPAEVFLFGDTTDKHQLYELHLPSLSNTHPHNTHGIIKVIVIIVTIHRIR